MSDKILSELYYDPTLESAFSSISKLHAAAKAKDPSITLNRVKEWLKTQLTYTLHKPARRRFTRNPIIVNTLNEQWQADLVDMQAFTSDNPGYKYILTVIDLFSKYAWAVPLKDKSGSEVKKAFEHIFSDRKPLKLQTDKGKEFINSTVQQYLKKINVHFFTSKNDEIKCAVVERFNRTLKSKMFKYFTAKGTRKYVNVLPLLVKAYNNSVHRTTKMKPVDVTHNDVDKIFKNIYGAPSRRILQQGLTTNKIKPGEAVRIKYKLNAFDKGCYPLWTDNILHVKSVNTGSARPTYKLSHENGKVEEKRFYPEDVQAVTPGLYRVEKIVKERRRRGKLEYLIKWLNYPDSYNSWEPATNVRNL